MCQNMGAPLNRGEKWKLPKATEQHRKEEQQTPTPRTTSRGRTKQPTTTSHAHVSGKYEKGADSPVPRSSDTGASLSLRISFSTASSSPASRADHLVALKTKCLVSY